MVFIDIRGVQGDQLGDPQPAGHEQHQDTVITQRIRTVTDIEKFFTIGLLKVARQRCLTLGHVQLLRHVALEQMALVGQIIEKGLDR